MHLERLEIQGFKSFAQKTVFEFPHENAETKGITAVVGPNGSGKSNVSDAIRWVLGEQSLKLLRGKKSEDVIFFGSDKKGRLGFAQVSLHFNNTDHVFPVDFEEVVIMRRIYRDGESEYLLNNSRVRLSDIVLLLAQAQFAQKSYAVIGQGMIETVLNAPPAERRDFFYEATGVKQYQIKKDQANSKMKATRENLAQAQIVLTELEPKLKFFKRQIARLEQREQVEKELRDISTEYYNGVWNTLFVKVAEQTQQEAQLTSEGVGINTRYEEARDRFAALEQSSANEDALRHKELQGQFQELQAHHNRLTSQRASIEGKRQAVLQTSGATQVAWLERKQTELEEKRSTLQQERDRYTQEQHESQEKQGTAQENLAANEVLLMQKEEARSDLMGKGVSISFDAVLEELRTLATKHSEISEVQESEPLKEHIAFLYQKLRALIDTMTQSKQDITPQLRMIEEEIRTARKECEQARRTLEQAAVSFGVAHERLSRIENTEKQLEEEIAAITRDVAYHSTEDVSEKTRLLDDESASLQEKIAISQRDIAAKQEELGSVYGKQQDIRTALLTLQHEIARIQKEREGIMGRTNTVQLELARLKAHQEDLLKKIFEELAVAEDIQAEILGNTETLHSRMGFSPTAVCENTYQAEQTIMRLKRRLMEIGSVDQEALTEYESTKERFEFLNAQVDDLEKAIVNLQKAIQELDSIVRERFETAIEAINSSFGHYFSHLFNGGIAKISVVRGFPDTGEELEDEQNEEGALEAKKETESEIREPEILGVEVYATPPGKKVKSITVLSGGEKAMTAVALICAIISNNPSPFVVLDEVDAALDEANAQRFAQILAQLAHRTQFIVVTHNRVTMHVAKTMYGVTMGEDGISRVVGIQLDDIEKLLDKKLPIS